MQFKCQTNELMEGLQTATKALSPRTTNPILEGVLVEAFGDEVQLICSDERLTIATRIPAEILDPGRGVVTGRLFSEFVRRLQGGEMTVTMGEEDGTETPYVLHAGDSVHFGKGTKRGCLNTGCVSAQMLVIMIKA